VFDIFALGKSSGDSTDVYLDIVRHGSDLIVALDATRMASFSEGLIGLGGATAAVITLWRIWPKTSPLSSSSGLKSE
jgi:hypothetical protein